MATATKKTITEAHKADLKAISKEMMDLAQEHDFCSEFYDAIERLNKRLNQPLDLGRDVTVTVSLYVHVKEAKMESGFGFPALTGVAEDEILKAVTTALAKSGLDCTDVTVDEVEIND